MLYNNESIVRKSQADIREQVDFRIMSWCWLMFLALDLNRRNINRGTFIH